MVMRTATYKFFVTSKVVRNLNSEGAGVTLALVVGCWNGIERLLKNRSATTSLCNHSGTRNDVEVRSIICVTLSS